MTIVLMMMMMTMSYNWSSELCRTQEKRAATFTWHRQSWPHTRTLSHHAADSMDRLLFLRLERNSMDWKGFRVVWIYPHRCISPPLYIHHFFSRNTLTEAFAEFTNNINHCEFGVIISEHIFRRVSLILPITTFLFRSDSSSLSI